MNVLVLYTRVTGYWMSCMRHDHRLNGNQFLVFRMSPSLDAPFLINSEDGIKIYDFAKESPYSIHRLISDFGTDVVYVAGWKNRRYLQIAKDFRGKGLPVLLGMDNQWMGSIKQYVACFFARKIFQRYFTHIWIPGIPQYKYAQNLGFERHQILTGLYCADETIFNNILPKQHDKKLTFIGRIVRHKGIEELFQVVEDLIRKNQFDLDLHIIGNGPLEHLIPSHSRIKHTPFVSPDKLPALLMNAGTLILPSLYEAWGVVVHEATLAGLPIITTYQCGAGAELVVDGFNGYKYNAFDTNELFKIIQCVKSQSTSEYFEMSMNSKHLASNIDLKTWSAKLNSVKKNINITAHTKS